VRDERRGDAGGGGDGAQRHGRQALLEGEVAGGAGDVVGALGRRLAGGTDTGRR